MTAKILIFYISRYSGHYRAATAIEKALRARAGDVDVRLVNAFDYMNPIISRIVNRAYIEVIKKKPEIWGGMYDNPEVLEKAKKIREVFHRHNMPKMKKLMSFYRPDFVYCTQAYPCGLVADYKRVSGDTVPLAGVLTDHAPHSYWIFEEVDLYVVPSDSSARSLVKKGVPEEKIKVYGIPVDMKFIDSHDREKIRAKYGFSPARPIVLIMGGSQGLGAIEEIVTSLEDSVPDFCQLVVVAGNNKRLYRRLGKLFPAGPVKVFSFVEDVDELMEAADLLITKAGGITTSEALAKKLPLLIVDPIPGQERMNTDFLVAEGAAVEAASLDDVPFAVKEIINSTDLLNKMKENASRLSKPDSAVRIAELAVMEP